MPTRRAVLLLPLLGAACEGDPEPAIVPAGPLGYGYLTPLPLNVATVAVADTAPPSPLGDIGMRLVPTPAEAMRIMARDRLVAVGNAGEARFAIGQAAIIQGRESLTCLLACRLEIVSPEGTRQGFVEAQTRKSVQGPDATRPRAADALLRRAMDDLNVEFEFQARRALKDWLVRAPAGPEGGPAAPPAGEVTREDLPKD